MMKTVCVMFPYPSAAGLHMGHAYNYAVMDSYCRWLRFTGDQVFQPFGYDSFGLPAENYARKIGGDPRVITYENIENFRNQMGRLNTQFDERLVTSDPSYIRWTQWLFTRLREKGLAYKSWGNVNFCPSCDTVLANEQVHDEHCERCGTKVEQRNLNQWFFKITDYKDRLLKNLDTIDYPESTIKQQRVWIENLRDWCVSRQRSWGCPIPVEGETDTLDTFVDSSFYYLRYMTDSQDEFLPKADYSPITLYVGGPEHACMHLIYARFIHMFLYDIGVVPQEEPFQRVVHQGMILKDGAKMSKSKGNVVNPDDYDPDELRMYLMFIGHYFDGGVWDDQHLVGIKRFLRRFSDWLNQASVTAEPLDLTQLETAVHGYTVSFKFNKVVSSFMEFYNKNKKTQLDLVTADRLRAMITCFAPGFK